MELPSSCWLHDAPRQPIARTLPITSSRLDGVTSVRPSSSCNLEPPSTARLFPGTAYSRLALLQRASESPPKNAAAGHQLLQHALPHHKPKRATIPKTGREPPGSNVIFCIGFLSITLRPGGAASSFQKLLSYQADGIEVHNFFFLEFVSSIA